MVINKKKFFKNIIFFLVFLSILFRGPTFFKILPSNIGEIRISYLILFFLCFIIFFLVRHKVSIIEFFIFFSVFITIFFNILFLQAFNFEYLVYLLQVFMYYYIFSALIKIIDVDELYKKLNNMLIIFGIMSVYEILTGKLIFHITIPYEINSFSMYDRAYLFFYNGNNLSLFLLCIYILVLGYNLTDKGKTKYLIIHQISLLFILTMNVSKFSLVIFIISTVLFLFKKYLYNLKKKDWRNLLYGISSTLLVLVLIKIYIDSNILFISEFISSAKINLSNEPRIELYLGAINTFYHNPFGIGLGNSDFYFSTNVHSIIIQLIVEMGIFGLLFWVAYYFLVFAANFNDLNYKDRFIANIIKYHVILFPIISMQVSRVISDNALIFIWALSLALLKYYSRYKLKYRVKHTN